MTGLHFVQVHLRQAHSPNSMIPITTVGITMPMARFWCAMWLFGLFLDVGAETILDSVENVNSDDWDKEKDESEGDGEKGDQAGDLEGGDCVVCELSKDEHNDRSSLNRASSVATRVSVAAARASSLENATSTASISSQSTSSEVSK